MEKEFISHSVQETLALGREFVSELNRGDIVCLKGGLGSGKTHFVKGMAQGLGLSEDDVHSPTFTLIHEYKTGSLPLYHFDCYRMESPREALEIGAEEYFYGEGVSVVEWPEKIQSLIPPDAVWIEFEITDSGNRKIVITKNGQENDIFN